ncbi:MAG: desulfoferrodoxin [Firmicutes bacterium]|nr:desulfoferrodoxin [Bacillota bacterium]
MTKLNQVYECKKCGNMVEMVRAGAGILICCGAPMILYEENTVDASREKHVPVVTKTANGYQVKVGSAVHPMEDVHFIEWIELMADGIVYREYLKPGDLPEAEFCLTSDNVYARAFCNLHGLWKGEPTE